MKRVCTLSWSLLLTLSFLAFLAVGGIAAEIKQGANVKKSQEATREKGPPMVQMGLEPKAVEILKAACDRLTAARTMHFTAVVSYENPSLLGTPLLYTTKSEVTVQRPDKLLVLTPGDGPATEFYYDGKMMAAYAPAENLLAVAEAPPTIDAALQAAYDQAAIYFPFTDVIVSDPYKDIADGLMLAFYIGQSNVIGGTTTDMVAYANNDVFVQIWIGTEDKLPRMLRAVYRADPASLRHQLELSDWQLDLAVSEDIFTPANTDEAKPIAFARPDAPAPTNASRTEKSDASHSQGMGN